MLNLDEWLTSILNSYIESGIFVAIFFIIHEILEIKPKKKVGFHLFIALLVFLYQCKIVLLLKYESLPSPWLFLFSISGMFLIGPIQYGQTLRILGMLNFRQIFFHYSIGIFTTILEIITILKFPEFIPQIGITKMSVIAVSLLSIIYYSVYFYFNQKLFSKIVISYKIKHSRDIIRYNKMAAFFVGIGCVSLILSRRFLFEIDGFLFSTGGYIALYYFFKHQDFFDLVAEEVAQKKYEKTSISDLDLDVIKKKIESLMLDKKYYQDDQIYIDDIANELLINKNQLSRILNESYNKNFYQFINFYRIQEAKDLLISHPNKTILEIAYEVGFKSKSAFYKNFVELTNFTPQDYRKANLK